MEAAAVHSRAAALVLLALLSLVWGVHWVVVKTGLQYMPPFTYGALRISTGLLALVVLLAWRRRLVIPSRRDIPIILSIGLAQIAASIILVNLALQVVPAGRSSVVMYTMPLWVLAIQGAFFGVRPGRREVAGLVAGVVGLAALVGPVALDLGRPGEVTGMLVLLLASMLWAATTIHVRRHHWILPPIVLQPWQLLAALVPMVLFALALEPGATVQWSPVTVAVILYSGPLATAFAFWASQSIIRSLGPLASTTGYLAVPVVGLISGALILHESLGLVDLAGFGLVVAGIAATSLTRPEAAGTGASTGHRPPATDAT
jgi:drug/metabolite transporter (DMT)-like permease